MPTTTSKPVAPLVSPSSWGSTSAALAPPPLLACWSLSMNTYAVTPLPGATVSVRYTRAQKSPASTVA
jgi:hypothetical protein